MKTAISIPDDLFQRADRLARRMDISRSELHQRALHSFVSARDEEEVTDTLNRIHEKDEPGSVDRVVERLRNVWLDSGW